MRTRRSTFVALVAAGLLLVGSAWALAEGAAAAGVELTQIPQIGSLDDLSLGASGGIGLLYMGVPRPARRRRTCWTGIASTAWRGSSAPRHTALSMTCRRTTTARSSSENSERDSYQKP